MADTSEDIILHLVADYQDAKNNIDTLMGFIKRKSEETGLSFHAIGNALSLAFKESAPAIKEVTNLLETAEQKTQALKNGLAELGMATDNIQIDPKKMTEYEEALENMALATGKTRAAVSDDLLKRDIKNQNDALDSAEAIAQKRAEMEVKNSEQFYAQRNAKLKEEEKLRKTMEENKLTNYAKELDEVNKLSSEIAELNKKFASGRASVKEYADNIQRFASPQTIAGLKALSPEIYDNAAIQRVKAGLLEIQQSTNQSMGRVKEIFRETFSNVPREVIDEAGKQIQDKMIGWSGFIRKVFTDIKAVVQTAFGTLIAVGIFNALQAVSDFFTTSLKLAKDFEREMRELSLAEVLLSKAGMEVTKKDLDDLVSYIRSRYKYLSELEVTNIVGNLGIVKDYGLETKDLQNLADVIGYMSIQAKLRGEQIDGEKILNALLDGRANALNQYGINLSDVVIEQEAERMGMEKVNGEYSKHDKLLATISVAQKATAGNQKEFLSALDGSREGMELYNKVWLDNIKLNIGQYFLDIEFSILKAGDALRTFGKILEPIIGRTEMFSTIWDGITLPIRVIIGLLKTLATIMATASAGFITFFAEILNGVSFADAFRDAGKNMGEAFKSGFMSILDSLVGTADNAANRRLKGILSGLGFDLDAYRANKGKSPAFPETPTGEGNGGGGVEQEADNLQKALDKFNQEILESQLKLQQDMEDAATELGDKLYDITVEYEQKRADAYRDYEDKIADIQRAFTDKIADIEARRAEARAKARQDEIDREREFQNKLQEMKEDFLMDLDDALHARDARQILKLIRQYELEKKQAERKHELDKKSAAEDAKLRDKQFAADRKRAEDERKAKMAEALADFNAKIAKLALDESLERTAARLKYERELRDLEKAQKDRLEIVAANLVNEFKLTEKGLQAILKLYSSYYSNVYGIYQAMRAMMVGMSGGMTPTYNPPGGGGTSGGGGGGGVDMMAEGGTIIANRPTTVTFGEAGLEAGTFVPIGRTGRDVNKVFSNLSGGGAGADGKVSIELLLSPDLESRIVRNTLNKTAEVFTRVQRSKG